MLVRWPDCEILAKFFLAHFVLDLILSKLFIKAIFIKIQIVNQMKYVQKGHQRSHKVTFVYRNIFFLCTGWINKHDSCTVLFLKLDDSRESTKFWAFYFTFYLYLAEVFGPKLPKYVSFHFGIISKRSSKKLTP